MAPKKSVVITDIPRTYLPDPKRTPDVFVRGGSASSLTPEQIRKAQALQQEQMDFEKKTAEQKKKVLEINAQALKESQQRAIERKQFAARYKGLSDVAAKRKYAQEVRDYRKAAGTFGKGLDELQERKRFKEFESEQAAEKESVRQNIATAIKEGRAVNIAPEGIYIEQKPSAAQRGYFGAEVVSAAPKSANILTKGYVNVRETAKTFSYRILPDTEKTFGTNEKIVKDLSKISEFREQMPSYLKWVYPSPKELKIAEFEAGYVKGEYSGLREKPLKVALITAGSFALPKGLGLLGSIGGKVAKFTKISNAPGSAGSVKFLGSLTKVGLPTSYAALTTARVLKEDTAIKKGFALGEITSTEIAPGLLGGYAGAKLWPRLDSYVSTIGRKEIAAEKLIPADVLTGKNRFPLQTGKTPSAEKQLKLFLKQSQRIPGFKDPMMYHATGKRFYNKDFKVRLEKTSEFPGLYGSYGVSPNFLRVSSKTSFYGGKLFNPYGKPGVLATIPKGFVIGKSAKGGKAFIPGIKTEVEAVLPPGVRGEIINKDFFFKYKGIRIPIDVAKVSGGSSATLSLRNLDKVVKSSYYGAGSYSITTPGSYGLGSLVSYKRLTSSSKVPLSRGVSSALRINKLSIPNYSPVNLGKLSRSLISKPSKSSLFSISKPAGGSIYPIAIPKSYITTRKSKKPPLYLNLKGIIPKQTKTAKGYEDIALVESFTSRALNLKPIGISEKQLRKLASSGIRGLNIQKRFFIIPDIKPRKRRKK